MSTKKHFLFIVFNDPVVVGVIEFLSSVLKGGGVGIKPHLTIQGPFEEKVHLSRIQSVKERLRDDIFFIGNPGVFETDKGAALYLSVKSDNLRRVWDKPDFPVEKYGFNPHITIYEGADVVKAQSAWKFLKKNRIELLCREYEIAQYVPKQFDMFPLEGVEGDENAIGKLMVRGKLSSSFRSNFMSAVNGD